MTPAAAIAQLDRQLAQHGQPVTLRRPGATDTDVALTAFVRVAKVDPLAQGVDAAQAGTMVVLSPTGFGSWPAPPARGDQLLIAGRLVHVDEAEVVRMGASVVRYNRWVAG